MKPIRLLFVIVALSVVAILLFPIHLTRSVRPAFNQLLVRLTEEEALRMATHLTSSLPDRGERDPFRKEHFLPRYAEEIETFRRDLNLAKIKLFSSRGEILHSSDPKEIGETNHQEYFWRIVARGTPYTKVVRKPEKTLEGESLRTDVVETYVPVMRSGRFAGAFEIYYDISRSRERLDRILRESTYGVFAVTFGFLAAVSLSSVAAYRSIRERNRMEDRLRELAETDPLTKCYNRRSMFRFLDAEADRANRYGRPFSVILLDLDRFKSVNDTHGHDTGDSVLAYYSDLVRQNIRGSDIFARYGGEEFLVIATETDLSSACILAGRIRKVVAEHPHETAGTVTISAGVCRFREGEMVSDLLRRVDRALYSAKDGGRNRVEIAD